MANWVLLGKLVLLSLFAFVMLLLLAFLPFDRKGKLQNSVIHKIVLLFLIMAIGYLMSHFLPLEGVYPLPHQVTKYPDGISLRFAMVHDVIHDRYPRHGKAFYQERNRQILAAIDKVKDKDGLPPEQFGLVDDLGVGYDRLGLSNEGVRVLRKKLNAQLAHGMKGGALYTSYANLGTFLIHANFPKARKGDKDARERLKEGIAFIHKSIEVNPAAHFGREIWQAVAAEFFLATIDDPTLLLKYDMVGNSLVISLSPGRSALVRGMSYFRSSVRSKLREQLQLWAVDPVSVDRSFVRSFIRKVAPEWNAEVASSHKSPVPFDEPVLGIIGMWRLGGGANSHFALALGEIMNRVNQLHLAWTAYQRAIREVERFSPDTKIKTDFVSLCQTRQSQLGLDDPAMKAQFDAELKFGQDYQKAYQKHEEEQIAAGNALNDPHFYDAFHTSHPKIATPVGRVDFMEVTDNPPEAGIFLAGFFGLLGGIYLRWRSRKGLADATSNGY